MKNAIATGLCIAAICIAAVSPAKAAVWHWGCQVQLGGQQIIFNRFSLVVVDTKTKMGDIRKLRMTEIDLPAEAPPHVKYVPDDVNGGFEKTMTFTHKDDPKRKVTLTEKKRRAGFPTNTN